MHEEKWMFATTYRKCDDFRHAGTNTTITRYPLHHRNTGRFDKDASLRVDKDVPREPAPVSSPLVSIDVIEMCVLFRVHSLFSCSPSKRFQRGTSFLPQSTLEICTPLVLTNFKRLGDGPDRRLGAQHSSFT